ncbi:MAG: hypothetical protein J5802_11910 [Butyrivibrio sp.]|nr:hypothetical protein [Butyrivibrio sp.]
MTRDKRILFIGGSPCSGKSTVAERISKEYGACYFKVDDFLDEFTKIAAGKGKPICKQVVKMTSDEIWMRDPNLQCDEEILIYEEISDLVFEKLEQTDSDFIVTEGAAYTPDIMRNYSYQEYISIVPSAEFQVSHYKKREWVPYILEGCADKQKAFDNWMERDILFAQRIKAKCDEYSIPCIVNDGTRSIDELYKTVKEMFILE